MSDIKNIDLKVYEYGTLFYSQGEWTVVADSAGIEELEEDFLEVLSKYPSNHQAPEAFLEIVSSYFPEYTFDIILWEIDRDPVDTDEGEDEEVFDEEEDPIIF